MPIQVLRRGEREEKGRVKRRTKMKTGKDPVNEITKSKVMQRY